MALSNLVQYESESESSSPQPDETRPEAASEVKSRLHKERPSETVLRPFSTADFGRPAKRDYTSVNADDEDEASEKPSLKRRRKGVLDDITSVQAKDIGVPHQRLVFKSTITQKVVAPKEIFRDEDATDVDEEDEEESSEVANGGRHMGKQKVDEGPEREQNEEGGGPGAEEMTLNFFKDLYHTRFGLLNLGRLVVGTKYDPAYTIYRDKIKGKIKQTERQQQLESFFESRPTIGDAKRRLEFLKPYMDRTHKDKIKKWSGLSLLMRLNLIESLRDIESMRSGEGESLEDLHRKAKKMRVQCENAQYHTNHPWKWEKYEGYLSPSDDEYPRDEKSLDDQLLDLWGEDEDEGGEDTTPSPQTPTKIKPKTPFKWEHFKFTPPQQTNFTTLCQQTPIPDIAPTRVPNKGQWKAEEYRFLHQWMTFKGARANWKPRSPDVAEMGLAHKAFFTDFVFQSGKKKSLCRGGVAILRQLRGEGGAMFAGWFCGEKGGKGGAAVGDEVAGEEGEAGGGDGGGDKDCGAGGDVSNGDEEAEGGVELNSAGRLAVGGKSTADMKRLYEEKTGLKPPDWSEDNLVEEE